MHAMFCYERYGENLKLSLCILNQRCDLSVARLNVCDLHLYDVLFRVLRETINM